MKISVRTIKNENFAVEIVETASIKELRAAIANDRKVDPRLIRIIYKGKALDDAKLASYYGLLDESILTIVINTRLIEPSTPVISASTPVISAPTPVGPPSLFGTQPSSLFGAQPSSLFGTQPSSLFGSQPAPLFGGQANRGAQSVSLFGSQPTRGAQPVNLFESPVPEGQNSGSLDLGAIFGNMMGEGNMADENGSEMLNGGNILPLMLMGAIMNDPEMRRLYQENPRVIRQLITDPNFLQEIVNGIDQPDMATPESLESVDLNTTFSETEENDIKELVELGMSNVEAKQFYLVANKNKMMAANMFFNQ